MAQVKGIYGDGTGSKKKKTTPASTGSMTGATTQSATTQNTTAQTTKKNTAAVPAQSTNAAKQEQIRAQQYLKQQSAAGTSASTGNTTGSVAAQSVSSAWAQQNATPVQSYNDARQEQLAARKHYQAQSQPQMDSQELAYYNSAKKQAEEAWNEWVWKNDYNPNSTTQLEDFYRKAGIELPQGTSFDGKTPTVQQLYEAVQRGKAEAVSAEAARREQQARRARELEAFFEQMDREWYSDDAEWQKSHQDADSARAEQRAAKDYREKQEKAQQAKDLSTQAAINEKFAVRDYLASQPGKEYTETDEGTEFWRDILDELWDSSSHYSPYQDLWENTLNRAYEENQKTETNARNHNERYEEGERVFDEQGHINGQTHPSIGGMRFGNSNVATSGCGAIAVYNVLQDLGKTNVTLSEIIQTAEENGYMLAGGKLGIMSGNLSKLMDDYGIDHHEVDPWKLDEQAKNGEIPDGTKYLVAAWNSSKNQVRDALGNAEFEWSMMGIHNYELMFSENSDRPWIAYNMYGNRHEAISRRSLAEIAGQTIGQIIAVYEVEE